MQRREFIKAAGAAGALALAGDGMWYAFADGRLRPQDGEPYAAWSDWDAGKEPTPLKLVRAAILAASPHNTQPWRFRVGDRFIELYLETCRSVRGLDPYLREAYIGMGCALENLLLAATANGYAAHVTLAEGALQAGPLPDRERQRGLLPAARVDLSAATAQASELYQAIPRRRTNRSPYDPERSLPPGFAERLVSACWVDQDVRLVLVQDRERRERVVTISAAANLELYSDVQVEKGSEAWIRWRSRDVQEHRDGLTIDSFGLSPAGTALAKLAPVSMLKWAAAPERRSSLYAQQMESAQLIGLIAVRDRLDIRQNLLAGRVWQRAHLAATVHSVGARPCNEAIEMIDHERFRGRTPKRQLQLGDVIGDESWQPTFLFLMGRPAQEAVPSPRRPIELAELS